MFTNDKHSRNLCPTALDIDLLLASHPYIGTKVLPKAPKWSLNCLGFNSPWTLLGYFPSTLITRGSCCRAQQKAPGDWMSRAFWPLSSVRVRNYIRHKLHHQTCCIWSRDCFSQGQETMGCQHTDRAPWLNGCLFPGGSHFRTSQTFKQWLTARVAHSIVCTLLIKLHHLAQWQNRETCSFLQ